MLSLIACFAISVVHLSVRNFGTNVNETISVLLQTWQNTQRYEIRSVLLPMYAAATTFKTPWKCCSTMCGCGSVKINYGNWIVMDRTGNLCHIYYGGKMVRVAWLGHVAGLGEIRSVYRNLIRRTRTDHLQDVRAERGVIWSLVLLWQDWKLAGWVRVASDMDWYPAPMYTSTSWAPQDAYRIPAMWPPPPILCN